MRNNHILGFKYLGYVLDKSSTDGIEYHRKLISEKKIMDNNRSLINVKRLQFDMQE